MFDFLNESKRQFLLNHRVLGTIPSSQEAISDFIDNLSAFESDLCSKTDERGAMKPPQMVFTKDEIERLKIYARDRFSQDITRLSKRILAESGFEIFYHGGDRQDLNDWVDDPDGSRIYVRGIHNLSPNYHREMLEKGTAQGSGIPVQNLYPSQIGTKELQIQIKKPHHAIIEELNPLRRFNCYSYYEIFVAADPAFVDEGSYKINIAIRMSSAKEYPNYLRTQLLCKELIYEKVRVSLGTRPTKIKVPHPFFGFIRIKRKKIEHQPQFGEKRVLKNAKWMPLNNIITINDPNPAYLLQFFLPKVVKCDIIRLRVSGYPLVSVILSKNLLEEIVSFLLHNPDLYCDLVRGFLPKQLFPHINMGILEAPSLPTKGIIFDNFTDGSRIKVI